MDEKERALRRWFEAWLTNDGSCIGELFAPDAVYSECWGPVYRGRAQIARWFADWNAGGRVLAWRIGRVLCAGAGAAAEWYFYLKENNNDRAYFPFQKVVMTVGSLIVLSAVIYFLT